MKFSIAVYVALTATAMAAPAIVKKQTESPSVDAQSRKQLLEALIALSNQQHNDKNTNQNNDQQKQDSQAEASKLSEWEQKMLDSQNQKRSLHQDTDSLEWSDDLKNLAQKYADNYDCSGNMAHHNEFYEIGENLAVGYDDVDAVDAWYNEIKYYDYNNPVYQSKAGHFTQMVWKNTKKMGCAYKTCGGDLYNYIVCEYAEAGNWDGEFQDNVKPLK